MIIRPHTVERTPVFSGFTASPNDSLFSGDDFSPVITGLAQKQRQRSSEAALWLRFLNPCTQRSTHTPDPTVLHQLCDLWHCNTEHNTHTHAHTQRVAHRQARTGGEQAQTHAPSRTELHY